MTIRNLVRAELCLALALLATTLPAAAQLDGASALREGNALFRSGLYHTALVRYREAAAAGVDSPLLHYNLGVTYYRLERFAEAQESFERATQDPTLGPLAAYNLGLAYRATGDSANAQRWFDAAAAKSPGLARGPDVSPQPQFAAARVAGDARTFSRGDERVGEFNVLVNAGYGQDDNANRTPAAPYVDLSAPGQPLVIPEPVVVTYTPIDVAAEYRLHNEAGDSDFVIAYQLDGDYYDDEFANSEVTQRLFFGGDLVLGEHERRSRSLRPGMFLVQHYQRNFDPDNGIDRDIEGLDVSLLYSYKAAGMDAEFAHTLGAWQWGFDLQIERREHERSPQPVPNFDNELYLGELFVRYALGNATTLSLELPRYRRVFDEYRARDLAGDMLSTNSPLEYQYSGASIGIDRRFGERLDVAFGYSRLTRVDGFVGYADYTQDVATLRVSFRPTNRWFLALGATSRVYDYANAFAYNEPTAGPKELDEMIGELSAEYRVSQRWSVSADLATQDVTSTDERAAYSRARTIIGATWRR